MAATLPELLSGLSLLLTTVIICLKDPGCMVGLGNAFQLPSLSVPAVHTQTRIIGQYPGMKHLLLCCISFRRKQMGKSRTSYGVFQNKQSG